MCSRGLAWLLSEGITRGGIYIPSGAQHFVASIFYRYICIVVMLTGLVLLCELFSSIAILPVVWHDYYTVRSHTSMPVWVCCREWWRDLRGLRGTYVEAHTAPFCLLTLMIAPPC